MSKRLAMCGAVVLVGVCGAAVLAAQATRELVLQDNDAWNRRSYVLSVAGKLHVQRMGRWDSASPLTEYAARHKGETFLLFEDSGRLYRLDTPAALQSLAELSTPLEHLAALQSELAASMAPLSMQQEALGAQMRGTRGAGGTQDYAAMSRIGREQGSVGRRQGEIGREQGVIGRQQGVLGRALYQTAQEVADRCLQEKSCPVVGAAGAASAAR